MKIDWHFDDEEWDPYTLLGEVIITGDHGTCIRDDCSMLDMWLLGISDGLESLSKGVNTEVDVEEPDPLSFVAADSTYEIRYKQMIVTFADITQAIGELKEAVQRFLQALLEHPPPRSEITINELTNILVQKSE